MIEKLKELEGASKGVFETLVGIDESGEGHMKDKLQLNINGWGTKWDVVGYEIFPSYGETCVELSFNTAWSPPIGFCQMLTKLYPVKCELHYDEGGNDFCGISIIENGEITDTQEYKYREGKYNLDKEGFWLDVESTIECNLHLYETGEEFLNEIYGEQYYLTNEDKNQIIERYNNLKEE